MDLFPEVDIQVIEVTTSDHLPLFLQLNKQVYVPKLKKLRTRRDAENVHNYNTVRLEFLKLMEKKEVYWKQRAKCFWLQTGDQNTRLFHHFTSARKKSNGFQQLKNEDGEWVETEEGILGIVTNYYSKLFWTSCSGGRLTDRGIVNQVSEEENTELVAEVTPKEVKAAIFSMFPEKAPGLEHFSRLIGE
ncbi:uncharacterized protein LOC141659985 [Apium graveolens]|uniref:uncharacterized protein LOC141659985 n=1 Tax=Apium graveolens TaxID=4045 RepID=UPI003D7A15DF